MYSTSVTYKILSFKIKIDFTSGKKTYQEHKSRSQMSMAVAALLQEAKTRGRTIGGAGYLKKNIRKNSLSLSMNQTRRWKVTYAL